MWFYVSVTAEKNDDAFALYKSRFDWHYLIGCVEIGKNILKLNSKTYSKATKTQ